MINIAIFVSGSGTNCENLIRYFKDSERVNCALVVSNKADAYGLVRAERLDVPTAITPKAELNDPEVMMPLLARLSTSTLPYCLNTVARACGDTMCMRR